MNTIQNLKELKQYLKELKCNLPVSENLGILAQPLQLGTKTVANRIAYQPMEGCDGTLDGRPDELTRRKYLRFAKGGAGLIWFEATAVQADARANPRQLFINEKTLDSFKELVFEIKETCLLENGFEPIIIMQATHSGRYSKPWGIAEPVIAYNNPLFEKENPIKKCRIISDDTLDRVGENMIKASVLAEQAGFDGVDIKACHRYLMSELLSAYERDGRYGGSFENRARLLLNSVKGAMQSCSNDFIVTTRLNAYDGFPYPYGFGMKKGEGLDMDLSEPKKLIGMLYNMGMKIINITMGNPYVNPHVNRPYQGGEQFEEPMLGVERMLMGTAEIQRSFSAFPMICSGLSYLQSFGANVVAGLIAKNMTAMAGFGRLSIAYPDLANDILKHGGLNPAKCCITCSKCTSLMRAGKTPGCIIRDKDVYAPLYQKYCGRDEVNG